jgi:hypothetical protein
VVNQTFIDKYIVGAYATSPNLFSWDKNLESIYFSELKKLNSIRGLELPFWGESLHPFNDEWLLDNLDSNWQNVLTCVPGTMKSLQSNPHFGLASKNDDSRKKAVLFYKKAFNCINKLKNHFGNKSVIGIYITSSPYQNEQSNYSDKKSFLKSLLELASWDWGNTKIFVEHCDAFTKNNLNPNKGFLSLENEISAIKQVNAESKLTISIVINWGRSVIEYRNIKGPIRHLEYAIQNKVLGGLMFSGTTSSDNNHYGAWSDLHMPPAPIGDYQYFEPESLMTYENIKKTLASCDLSLLDCLGIKLLAMPKESSINKRIAINKNSMDLINQVITELN